MDLGVNPDRVNAMNDKSTMNKIMEYMSLGKAMVQFDVTEGRYSAQEASLYAAANDPQDMAGKILELVDDPARREEMGRSGRRRVVEELNWQHQIEPLLDAYRQALED
jgi:glycosyltransferase involved in cell wall biosynthesis